MQPSMVASTSTARRFVKEYTIARKPARMPLTAKVYLQPSRVALVNAWQNRGAVGKPRTRGKPAANKNEPAARNESGEGLRSPECEMVHFIPSKLVNMIWVVTFQAKPNDKRGPRSLSKQQGERRKSKARKVNKSVRACVCWGWCVSFPHLLSHSLTNAQTDTHAPGKRWMTPPRSSRSNACTPSLWKSTSTSKRFCCCCLGCFLFVCLASKVWRIC